MRYNFQQFIDSQETNLWIVEPGLEIYVRKSLVSPGLFDIANVNARQRGKGAYTAFLKRYDGYALRIENVISDRFADYHRKRGWAEIPCMYGVLPSFLNPEAVRRGLGVRSNIILHEQVAAA